jgi:hypothetical protein
MNQREGTQRYTTTRDLTASALGRLLVGPNHGGREAANLFDLNAL